MDDAAARRALGESVVATLATLGTDGRPHVVPICFALEDGEIYFAVDHKPKRTTDLQRLRNIAANPSVAVLAHHYEPDWSRLWWVRADGAARVLDPGPQAEHALDLLADRFPQYRAQRPSGPVVAIAIERVTGWSSG